MTHRMLVGALVWPFVGYGSRWEMPDARPRFLTTGQAVVVDAWTEDGSAVVRAAGDARLYCVPAGFLEPITKGVGA